jgi:hypothetical protein
VQTAYRNRNLCRLETLWATVQAAQGGSGKDADPDGIFLAALEMEGRLRNNAERLRQATHSLAFEFQSRGSEGFLPLVRRAVYRRVRIELKTRERHLVSLRKQYSKARWQIRRSETPNGKLEQLTFWSE